MKSRMSAFKPTTSTSHPGRLRSKSRPLEATSVVKNDTDSSATFVFFSAGTLFLSARCHFNVARFGMADCFRRRRLIALRLSLLWEGSIVFMICAKNSEFFLLWSGSIYATRQGIRWVVRCEILLDQEGGSNTPSSAM